MKPDQNPAQNYEPGIGPASDRNVERDPENRDADTRRKIKERAMDKTLADSFPTSDPPSSIPDPEEDEAA